MHENIKLKSKKKNLFLDLQTKNSIKPKKIIEYIFENQENSNVIEPNKTNELDIH